MERYCELRSGVLDTQVVVLFSCAKRRAGLSLMYTKRNAAEPWNQAGALHPEHRDETREDAHGVIARRVAEGKLFQIPLIACEAGKGGRHSKARSQCTSLETARSD